MAIDSNRLLMLWEKALKDINRAIINPKFAAIRLDDLKPVLELVARSRAEYMEELFEIAKEYPDSLPSAERIAVLKNHRERFQELVAAAQALETAVERNYLDVEP